MHIYARGRHETIAAYMYNEIMLPYAGIIRIRFMGMISASVLRGTPANIQYLLLLNQPDLIEFRPVLAGQIDLSGL